MTASSFEPAGRSDSLVGIKIGGSLLRRHDFGSLVRRELERAPEPTRLVIVGGGELINAVRVLDAIRPLPAAAIHWRCVALLDTTFEFAADWLPELTPIRTAEDWNRLVSGARPGNYLVRPGAFYEPGADGGLPSDWRTTTDAIAVQMTAAAGGHRTVLVKSCEIPAGSPEELASLQIIDPAAAPAARRMGVAMEVTTAVSGS